MKRLFVPIVALGLLASLALVPALSFAAQPGGKAERWWSSSAEPVSMEQAHERATEYLTQVGFSNLAVSEVMEFSNHFYAAVIDPASGDGAFELVISLDGRRVHPEPGPTMMWNTEYSPMSGTNGAALFRGMGSDMMGGGMMGGGMMGHDHPAAADCPSGMGYVADTGEPLAQPLTADAAVDRAQAWLDEERPGLTVADPIAFPGYVTVHVERGPEIVGMLSIQTTTGAIWEHAWHGDFVAQFAADH